MFRPRLVAVLLVGAGIAALTWTMHGAPPKLGPNPVVVELFTSQGCSSCPPADELIHEIARDPALRGRVIPLVFHVDYWDQLGWRDPFSSAEWTQRQVRYTRAMRLSSSYTPQAVVGGTRQFVGSSRSALNGALEAASNVKPAGEVALTVRREGNALIATIHARVPAGHDLFLAVTEDDLITKVAHGENAGRTLTNDAIVRRLVRVTPGQTMVSIPVDAAWRNLTAVAFLQNRRTLAIGAAAVARTQA
ncbi:MAG: hypothetical protein QOK37_110 [Thermoanaerobaculia bacterium]|jgi:hypothetical protein|nr:hypothetical protein [Thermoanaerobaculia bacterium]